MNRQEKEKEVQQLKENFEQSQGCFLVGYKGLTVEQVSDLRRKLREKGGTFKVAKLTLVKRAINNESGIQDLKPFLKEQLAIVFAQNESPAVAKVLYDFSKENEKLNIIVGTLEKELLALASVQRLAQLPSKEVLIAQLLGVLNAPIVKLVRVNSAIVSKLLLTLKEVERKKQ